MAGVHGTFGEVLRRERERQGVSRESLCGETKINPRHVQSLEEGDYRSLPGGVFRRGIVRAYLHALRLDETEWMPQFLASHAEYLRGSGQPAETVADEEAWAAFALNVKRNRVTAGGGTGWRWVGVLAGLMLLVAAGWAVWHFVLAKRLTN